MIKTRVNLKDVFTMVGVLALILVVLPLVAFVGVFARLPLLVAVVVAVVVAAVAAALSPAFREWISAEVDREITFNGLRLATGIALSPHHAWARITSDETWVGADDLIQAALGPVDAVNLPPPGRHVEQGEPLFGLRHGDRSVTVRSPVSGTVIGTNAALREDPGLINREPFSAGWAVRVEGDHPKDDRRRLLRGQGARAWFRHEVDRLLASIMPTAAVGAALPDGGELSRELWAHIDDATWRRLSQNFFGSG